MDPKAIMAALVADRIQTFDATGDMLDTVLETLPEADRDFIKHLVGVLLTTACDLSEMELVMGLMEAAPAALALMAPSDDFVGTALANGVSMN